jgi:S1-C subfamily serine protease
MNVLARWLRVAALLLGTVFVLGPLAQGVSAQSTLEGPEPARLQMRLQQAQQRLAQDAHEVAELSMQLEGGSGLSSLRAQSGGLPRAMFGVAVTDATSAETRLGVSVVTVSPGGPAEVAGLRREDVIISVQGVALQGNPTQTPRQQLLALMHDAQPGAPLEVRYRRSGAVHATRLVPAEFPPAIPGRVQPVPGERFGERRAFGMVSVADSSGFGTAELVELTPSLGKYFATDQGLLVVRAPRDKEFELEDGDVILDIDGRIPRGAAHAFEILKSYHPGEPLVLHVMRERRRTELTIRMPARSGPQGMSGSMHGSTDTQ